MARATVRHRAAVTLFTSIVILMLALPPQTVLAITVDIGTAAGEAGYTLTNFGPVEPSTHSGGWGGIASDPASNDRLCRTVWGYDENTTDASVTFPTPITSATIRHLDGGSDDSFTVEVGADASFDSF